MKKVVRFLVLLMVINLVLPIVSVYALKNSKETISGKYQFASSEWNNVHISNTFEYRDDFFTESSYLGNKELETLSIQVAASSISWHPKDDIYELDSSKNDRNIKEFLNNMKFKNITTNKYFNTEKHENSVGVIIGHKTIIQDDKTYTLLAIFPRSAGYKEEWVSNLSVGDGDIHDGFKQSRDEILRYTKQYIKENNIKGNIKVWTSGYSRGAAVSNVVAGFFAGGGIEYFDGVSITPKDVYCYTIGTPKGVKDGASKNEELSVSGNRSEAQYKNDTKGVEFKYTKGGKLNTKDKIYNGIRSVVDTNDSFALLPPGWDFTRYGQDVIATSGLSSEKELLKELNDINPYVYNQYTENGKIKQFVIKTFDLKTLSTVDIKTVPTGDFMKERLKGIEELAKTNKEYKDQHYQEAMASFTGIYGMASAIFTEAIGDVKTEDALAPLIYTYLAYVSEELQKEGKASNETEAVTLALEDLITYLTKENINKETFTLDDFIKLLAKYLSENENEPVAQAAISGIVGLVPENYQAFLAAFKAFDKRDPNTISNEDGLMSYIKACYYGTDPDSAAYSSYPTAEDSRKLLYMLIPMFLGTDIPEINDLIQGSDGNPSGEAKFDEVVDLIVKNLKKDEDKTYATLGDLADARLRELLDPMLDKIVNKSTTVNGIEYTNQLQKHVNGLKTNITQFRKILSSIFFYSKNGYNSKDIVENSLSLVSNASLIVLPHYDEIYLAQSRTSNRYKIRYRCIEGDDQSYNLLKNKNLTFKFNIDYDEFIKNGKVFIDGKEVNRKYYTVSKGSTVITFNDDYTKQLSNGNHTLTLQFNNEKVNADFTITNDKEEKSTSIKNPKTVDNIQIYITTLIISIIGLIVVSIGMKKSTN